MTNKYFISFLIIITLFIIILIYNYGYHNSLILLWNTPVMSSYFEDLLLITEYNKLGINPIDNSTVESLPLLNTPRVWEYFAILFDLNYSSRFSLGIFNICLYYTAFIIFCSSINKDILNSVILYLLFFSPASVLLMERGNFDLLIYFLVVIAIVSVNKPYIFSFVVLIASILKLFPIFTIFAFIKHSKEFCIKYIIIVLILFGIYVIATFDTIFLIMRDTPQSGSLSFGKDVLWMKLEQLYNEKIFESIIHYFRVIIYFYLLCSVIIIYYIVYKIDRNINIDTTYIDAFRIGGAIYLGSFILINNWDYRLVFLIFTIPQLYLWNKSKIKIVKISSIISMSSIIYTMWYLNLNSWFGRYTTLIDELSNLLLFSSLLLLTLITLPLWLLNILRLRI